MPLTSSSPIQPNAPVILILAADSAYGQVLASVLQENGFRPWILPDPIEDWTGVTLEADAIIIDWMVSLDSKQAAKLLDVRNGLSIPVLDLRASFQRTPDIASPLALLPPPLPVLMQQIRTLLAQERPSPDSDLIVVGDFEMDLARFRVRRGGRVIPVSMSEFNILKLFMSEPGRVWSRRDIAATIWPADIHVRESVVTSKISLLRKTLNRGRRRNVIRTVQGKGYVFDASPIGGARAASST